MSGPKIVRIVTREELIDICTALIGRLDDAIKLLESEGQRLGLSDAETLSAARQRRDELQALMERDGFMEIQKRAPQETQFLKLKLEGLRDEAIRAAALAREQAGRRRQGAQTLANEIRQKLPGKHVDVVQELELIARNPAPAAGTDALLAKGFRLLNDQPDRAQVTERQRQIANSLADGESDVTTGWRSTTANASDDRAATLHRRLATIETRYGSDRAVGFTQRLMAIERESAGLSQNMKMDALVLDVASAVAALQERQLLLETARDCLVEILDLQDASLSSQRSALESAMAAPDSAKLTLVVKDAATAIEECRQRRAAQARRVAVLSGLAALGYEVHEGMATAWAEQGTIVVRNPSVEGYGVEVSSPPDAQRMQVRTVAFSTQRDRQRDVDAETLWYGDFSKLQARMAAQAGALRIEKGHAVGEIPVKSVAFTEETVTLRLAPSIKSQK
jgi:hypothetical protein